MTERAWSNVDGVLLPLDWLDLGHGIVLAFTLEVPAQLTGAIDYKGCLPTHSMTLFQLNVVHQQLWKSVSEKVVLLFIYWFFYTLILL